MGRMLLQNALQLLLLYAESQAELASFKSSILALEDNTLAYVVGIRTSEGSVNECVGALIAKKYVLSSDCQPNWVNVNGGTLKSSADKQYASIGSRYNSGQIDGERIKIANWTRHPDFNSTTGEFNSILFTLATESKYKPIALPVYTGILPSVGSSATAKGWSTSSGNDTQVKQTHVEIISDAECKKSQTLYSSESCVRGNSATDACNYSKGSPVVIIQSGKQTLMGLVHVNNGCNKANTPTVVNRATTIRSWINQITNV